LAFQKPQHINQCQAQWIQILQEYNFTLTTWKEKEYLSRCLIKKDGEEEKEGDNQDVVVLPKELF